MSFLDKNNQEYITARLTQEGRNAIAKGDFKIDYFAVGDSEYNYNFTTGSQMVLAPMDKDTQVKYPLLYQSGSATIYGVPITGSTTETIKNVMGEAGFISGNTFSDGALVTSGSFTNISGATTLTLTVPSGKTYFDSGYITLFTNGVSNKTLTSFSNSYTYKLLSVSGLTSTSEMLTLDRATPNLSGLTGNFYIVGNNCENEFTVASDINNTCLPPLPDPSAQHNPWKLNTVWSQNPIGFRTTDDKTTGFVSAKYHSAKELLGYYSNSGQTFTDITGGTISGITYVNSFGEEIMLNPNQANTIAIVHYSEIGDFINDPDRYYKYDDYIAHTGQTDNTNFKIHIPFINYHRNTGTTIGAYFYMGTSNKYISSTPNSLHKIKYRDLIDEQNIKVGKVFVNNKLIVFDDQEIAAVLDHKSNRNFTLPAPKLELTHSTDGTYLLGGTTGETLYISYLFSGATGLNSYPCNAITNVKLEYETVKDECSVTAILPPSDVVVKFTGSTQFDFLQTDNANLKSGVTMTKFYILAQKTQNNTLPTSNGWRLIDTNTSLTNGYIAESSVYNSITKITKYQYDNASIFSLSDHTGQSYSNATTQFGDEQPFAGSVKLTRASDIEEMKFLVNLPSGKFATSQNPTHTTGNPMITEIALLDESKNVLVMGKTPSPISRNSSQVFAVKLDF
jgi:hypothetical protein